MATSTSSKVYCIMAMSTSIKGRRQLSCKKAKTRLSLIFVHVDQSSILRAEVKQTRRTVQNVESNFRRRLCNVCDDASPGENRSADQNRILIVVFARGLHDDVLPDEWILLYVAFCTIMAISRQKEAGQADILCAGRTNTPTHTCVAAQWKRLGTCRRSRMRHWTHKNCQVGQWTPCGRHVVDGVHIGPIMQRSLLKCSLDGTSVKTVIRTLSNWAG